MSKTHFIGLGAAAAIFFSALGSALCSLQGGIFATKSFAAAGCWSYAPIVINGVPAIYGLIIGVLIQGHMNNDDPTLELEQTGYKLLCSGLIVGLGCLASGIGMFLY